MNQLLKLIYGKNVFLTDTEVLINKIYEEIFSSKEFQNEYHYFEEKYGNLKNKDHKFVVNLIIDCCRFPLLFSELETDYMLGQLSNGNLKKYILNFIEKDNRYKEFNIPEELIPILSIFIIYSA